MASDLRIRVGGATAMITIGAGVTDAQVAAALTRFATSLGIPMTGTNVENLTAILEHFRDDVIRRSRAVQTAEKRAALEGTIQQEVNADNAL